MKQGFSPPSPPQRLGVPVPVQLKMQKRSFVSEWSERMKKQPNHYSTDRERIAYLEKKIRTMDMVLA